MPDPANYMPHAPRWNTCRHAIGEWFEALTPDQVEGILWAYSAMQKRWEATGRQQASAEALATAPSWVDPLVVAIVEATFDPQSSSGTPGTSA